MVDIVENEGGYPIPALSEGEKKYQCPRGHVLEDMGRRSDNGWSCDGVQNPDGCKSGFSIFAQTKGRGMPRFGCRTCNYDLCEKCLVDAPEATGNSNPALNELERGVKFGEFVIVGPIGEGRGGGVVYSAIEGGTKMTDSFMSFVAPTAVIKYPVKDEKEVDTMRTLMRAGCLGVPKVYTSGRHDGKLWLAMEMLKAPLHEVISLPSMSSQERWTMMQVFGRLVLRRLQAIHARGFVHCDVQTENIMLGVCDVYPGGGQDNLVPFFIDFGLAQRFPDGPDLPCHWTTPEYCSIRTAEGLARTPCDDLEALGWVLCHYAAGEADLPWFPNIKSGDYDDRTWRDNLIQEVKLEKIRCLEEGPRSLTALVPEVPQELVEYLRLCRKTSLDGESIDYRALYKLLGWKKEVSDSMAELWDQAYFCRLLETRLSPNKVKGDPYEAARKDFAVAEQAHIAKTSNYYVAGTWSNPQWALQRMSKDKSVPGGFYLDVQLLQDGGEFQIVRNRDLDQVFHPLVKLSGWSKTTPVTGPDKNSDDLRWFLPFEAGDIITIKFLPSKLQEGGLSWRKIKHEPLSPEVIAALPPSKFSVAGTWDKWKNMHSMTCFGERHSFVLTVGSAGRESFQIFVDKDWKKRVHPNIKRANPHVAHLILGPEHAGEHYNWSIGYHAFDYAGPGLRFEVRLILKEDKPFRVEWIRL